MMPESEVVKMFESKQIPLIGPDTRLLVLSGAGISAESGIRTFRDSGGFWEEYRVEDVATPEAFERDPEVVWRFYNERRRQARDVRPNPAHMALARLEERLPKGNFTVVTQNVDSLHDLAGSKEVLHMHGRIDLLRCVECSEISENMEHLDGIPYCGCGGMLRPHIVWFGEMPMYLDEINNLLYGCDIFLAVGTSGLVYPAAGFLQTAAAAGAKTVGVNLDAPANVSYFDYFFQGRAGEILPGLVDYWLEGLQSD